MKLLSRINEQEALGFDDAALSTLASLSSASPRNAVTLLEQLKHHVAQNGLNGDNLSELLPQMVEEFASIPPEILVAKYTQLLLTGSYKALAMARKMDSSVRFLQMSYKYLKGVLFAMKAVDVGDGSAIFQDFMKRVEFHESLDSSALLQMLDIHLSGYERALAHEVDAVDILDFTTLKSLEVIRALRSATPSA